MKDDRICSIAHVIDLMKETAKTEEFVTFSILVNGEDSFSTSLEKIDDAIKDLCDTFGSTYQFVLGDEVEIIKTTRVCKVALR